MTSRRELASIAPSGYVRVPLMNAPFELVIFDCDGVLVESEPLVNRVYLEMLAEDGVVLDEAATLREFAGAAMATRSGR